MENKEWSIHTMEYSSPIKRNEGMIHAKTRVNLKNIILREKKPDKKDYIVYDSVYINWPQKENL